MVLIKKDIEFWDPSQPLLVSFENGNQDQRSKFIMDEILYFQEYMGDLQIKYTPDTYNSLYIQFDDKSDDPDIFFKGTNGFTDNNYIKFNGKYFPKTGIAPENIQLCKRIVKIAFLMVLGLSYNTTQPDCDEYVVCIDDPESIMDGRYSNYQLSGLDILFVMEVSTIPDEEIDDSNTSYILYIAIPAAIVLLLFVYTLTNKLNLNRK